MRTEVLAPGGSLDHALWALEGGANAVYVGFQKFSARSHADNLSLDDMAVLGAAARGRDARIFCALNTILHPDEVAEAVALAWELHLRGVHALIVQDLGLALALKKLGPPIDLHASTQAAVHNPGGVAALKAMGFRRVVLARELTLSEIRKIVAADPTMEYEVFVHGALCYAVSGQCMASGLMIGRSANRGDCGQVCRTKFELDYLIPGPQRSQSPHEEGLPDGIHAPPGEVTWKEGTTGTFASMNDLELGSRIRELRDAGVVSFKIEGRMKPPAYAYNTARAYRAFLDGGRDEEAWAWLDEARLRFGRLPSAGWLDGHKALAQINPHWAGSLGMPLGVVKGGQGTTIKLAAAGREATLRTLAKGDGVMILGRGPGQTFRGALAGPGVVKAGQAELLLAEAPGFGVAEGTAWLLSRHDGKLPLKKGPRPWRHPVPLAVSYASGTQGLAVTVSTTAFEGVSLTEVLAAEPARGDKRFQDSLEEVLRASDSRFEPSAVDHGALEGPWFVPPKTLKEFRRRWWAAVEAAADAFVASVPDRVRAEARRLSPGPAADRVPPRADLSPRVGVNKLTGFVTDWDSLKPDHLAPWNGGLSLPLAPFTPEEEKYFAGLRTFLTKNPGPAYVLGLSNPAHLNWLHRLRAESFGLESWFGDWGFHAANPWTPAQLAAAAPGFQFALGWLEAPDHADRSYFPPLFTSRACMLRNSFGAQEAPSAAPTRDASFDSREWLKARQAGQPGERPDHGPRCPAGCAGHFSARLVQGKKQFRLEARDCINYLILETEG